MKSILSTIMLPLLITTVDLQAQTAATSSSPTSRVSAAPPTDPAQGAVWDLTVIFPDREAAERERAAITADLPSLSGFKGHLGDSAASLRAALDYRAELLERTHRVHRYAFLKVSEDARLESSQSLAGAAAALVD